MIGVEFTVPQYFKMNFILCTVHNKFDVFTTNILTTIFFRPTIVYETCKYAKKYRCLSNVGTENPLIYSYRSKRISTMTINSDF